MTIDGGLLRKYVVEASLEDVESCLGDQRRWQLTVQNLLRNQITVNEIRRKG
jgi:hypothetical protein